MADEKKRRFPAATPEELQALEEQHGDVLVMEGPEKAPWYIVVRRPTRQETIGYKTHARKEGQGVTANEALLKCIVIFPDPKKSTDLDLMIDTWGMFPDAAVNRRTFQDFIGVGESADLKG